VFVAYFPEYVAYAVLNVVTNRALKRWEWCNSRRELAEQRHLAATVVGGDANK